MVKNNIYQISDEVATKSFGIMPNGTEVLQYTLCNAKGAALSVISYGATITSLKIPNANGEKIDVVLGFDKLEDYINAFKLPSPPYLGTVVGRYAGRINQATFQLNGAKIQLSKNHHEHQLHGGINGFSQKLWKLMGIHPGPNPSVTMAYTSADNEENFPGTLTVKATYTLTENNELKVTFWAISTKDTIVNLTQHNYFNLDGHTGNIANQKLFVNSKKILETNSQMIPTGSYIDLENHPFDFMTAKHCPVSIDSTFVLANKEAAMLASEKSGIKMKVTTNQPAVHIYVGGNCFGQIKGKENTDYHPTSGICFEAQNFPDAPNHSHFPNAVLKKGQEYAHQTTFKFENL